ncbi:MAG: DNA polymerase III subunit gamma/tau [Flavobacteriales bacterium]|nr:DNA polymerase III subunit gamma/tau [Flavobacteriales bacterium]
MSDFIVSARKYRPSTFRDVVGQSVITNTLSRAIKDKHLAQSFLFCGPRGVGKTTCARILAKTINCLNLSEDGEACDICESCISFNENHSFNIHELDAASNNSVEDIRNLVDQVRFSPQVGEYNIYIIDEVHMLSSSAFNAFLKTLEEPPKHAIFILATTEKQKIIPTILSRCQIFDFKSINIQDIISHLEYVSSKEGIQSEKDALHIIAQKSGGSLRDSLSMFDRLVDSTELSLSYKSVIESLNILDHDYYLKITDQIISNDVSSVMLTINEIISNGFDAHQFIMGLASHFRDLLVCKDIQTIVLLDKGEDLKHRYLEQSKDCELSFLIKSLNMCNKCDVEYRTSKNKRLLIELTLLKMTTIGQFLSEKKNNSPIKTTPKTFQKEIIKEKSHDVILEDTHHKEGMVKNDIKEETVFKRKVRSSSFSLTEIMEDKKEKFNTTNFSEKKSKSFTEQEMQNIWRDYSENTRKVGKTNLFVTLSSFSPTLENEHIIRLKISNDTQQKILDENKSELINFLKTNLQNDYIEIHSELTEEVKNKIPYTSKDKFKKMTEENPSLKILQQKLGLDPDY